MANIQEIKKAINKTCWKANYDVDIGLTLQFGKPVINVGRPKESRLYFSFVRYKKVVSRYVLVRGEIDLWVPTASWKLKIQKHLACTSSSRYNQICRGLCHLEGQKLIGVKAQSENEILLLFDLESQLYVKRKKGDPYPDNPILEMQTLKCPGNIK